MNLLLLATLLLLSFNASFVSGSNIFNGVDEYEDEERLASRDPFFDEARIGPNLEEEEEEDEDTHQDVEYGSTGTAGRLRGRYYSKSSKGSKGSKSSGDMYSTYSSHGHGYGGGYGYEPYFTEYYNKGCRNYHGHKGYNHHDYILFEHVYSKSQCEQKCLYYGYDCYGYEYSSYHLKCEVWKVPIAKVQYSHGFSCYINDHY